MTDPAPNIEVVLSSDLFDDDPCLESMSVQATTVLDAYMTGYGWLDGPTKKDCRGVAAVLRAAADQVVPDLPKPSANSDYHLMNWSKSLDQYYQRQQTRAELLAIANELENTND